MLNGAAPQYRAGQLGHIVRITGAPDTARGCCPPAWQRPRDHWQEMPRARHAAPARLPPDPESPAPFIAVARVYRQPRLAGAAPSWLRRTARWCRQGTRSTSNTRVVNRRTTATDIPAQPAPITTTSNTSLVSDRLQRRRPCHAPSRNRPSDRARGQTCLLRSWWQAELARCRDQRCNGRHCNHTTDEHVRRQSGNLQRIRVCLPHADRVSVEHDVESGRIGAAMRHRCTAQRKRDDPPARCGVPHPHRGLPAR